MISTVNHACSGHKKSLEFFVDIATEYKLRVSLHSVHVNIWRKTYICHSK